jgi:hypothetical protein
MKEVGEDVKLHKIMYISAKLIGVIVPGMVTKHIFSKL